MQDCHLIAQSSDKSWNMHAGTNLCWDATPDDISTDATWLSTEITVVHEKHSHCKVKRISKLEKKNYL